MRRLALPLSDYCNGQFLRNFSLERLTLHETPSDQSSCQGITFVHDVLFRFLAQELALIRASLDRTSQQAND